MDEQHAENGADDTPMLTAVEARVLGVLMEKRRTTPDNYPLTKMPWCRAAIRRAAGIR